MEENNKDTFDKNAEERTMEFFSFSAKVFRWCRLFMIPVTVIYVAMMIYALMKGINSAGSVLLLVFLLLYIAIMPKFERAYRQYAREAQDAIELNSTEPYSQKALQLRNTQQKAGKGVYYLIAGMVIFLGLVCVAGGIVIMLLGIKWIFWGALILVLSIPCFLLGACYIGMGRSARR
jgi:membrane protein YdbS with pleckstrin-like domain